MAAGTYTRPLWHRKDLIDKAVALYNEQYKPRFSRFVKRINTKDRYFQFATFSDIPALTQVDELVQVPEVSLDTPFSQQIVPLSYKGRFKLSNEAYQRDPNGLYKKMPKFMSRAYMKSMDNDAAGFLARANDSTFITTPDGVALASTSHITSGSTFSNILSGNSPLTYNAAMNMILSIMGQPSYLDENMEIDGPFKLLVPISLSAIASNIKSAVNGGYRYDTADREPNWVGMHIAEVVVLPRSTSTTAWAMVPAKDEENPLNIIEGLAVDTLYRQDGDDWSHNWSLMGMYALAAEKAQGFGWSAGDGS